MASDNKLKHLELIQNVINRMASNSFLIKGWTITLVSAMIALSSTNNKKIILLALLPTFMFWVLDGYFLRQERLFRGLYDQTRIKDDTDIDFSMNTGDISVDSWSDVMVSRTLSIFYGLICVAIILVYIIMRHH